MTDDEAAGVEISDEGCAASAASCGCGRAAIGSMRQELVAVRSLSARLMFRATAGVMCACAALVSSGKIPVKATIEAQSAAMNRLNMRAVCMSGNVVARALACILYIVCCARIRPPASNVSCWTDVIHPLLCTVHRPCSERVTVTNPTGCDSILPFFEPHPKRF